MESVSLRKLFIYWNAPVNSNKKRCKHCSSANINLGHATAIKTVFSEVRYEWFTLVPLSVSLTTDGHQSVGWRWSIVDPADWAHPPLSWTSLRPAAEQSLHQLTTHNRYWMGLYTHIQDNRLKTWQRNIHRHCIHSVAHNWANWNSRPRVSINFISFIPKGISRRMGYPNYIFHWVHQSPKAETSALYVLVEAMCI